MFELTLRPTVINGALYEDDYEVVWISAQFGARSIGRIRRTSELSPQQQQSWKYHLQPNLPVPTWCNGSMRRLDLAIVTFRRVFERFHAETTEEQWHNAFKAQQPVALLR